MNAHPDMTPAQKAPTRREDDLALQVVELARGIVIANNPFLAAVTGMLTPCPAQLTLPLATNGSELYVDAGRLLAGFAQEGTAPAHDYAHALMHCVMLHPFVGTKVDACTWDLAADVVAEALAAELCGERPGERGMREQQVITQLEGDLGGPVTTERLYRALRDGAYDASLAEWERLFRSDDHGPWHVSASSQEGQSSEAPDPARDDEAQPNDGPTPSPKPIAPTAHARGRWERAAKSLRVDLETLSRTQGDRMGRLTRELEVSGHERMDYRVFLRQFAVRSEHLRVSDDEFDYVLYTYGLDLYRDMPLIEPLEYRDERRIRDFVIVIDTSSSVSGKVVQQFVDTTFDILSSEASFFSTVNIHIVQCDMRVQSDVKLTSLADLDRWRRNVKLFGFGGTDFRPAFRYVNELLATGEFSDLSGLIYFTDGWGTYPSRVPPYPTAFVFYDEDHRPDLVPAWAIQVVLHPGEYESLSVY